MEYSSSTDVDASGDDDAAADISFPNVETNKKLCKPSCWENVLCGWYADINVYYIAWLNIMEWQDAYMTTPADWVISFLPSMAVTFYFFIFILFSYFQNN